jgi:formate hydrogenlyase subunit 6/NADH:ubiquinone oxidoreductase subunit I
MTIGSMLGDIISSLFKKPITEKYPFERFEPPAALRGKLVYDPSKCSGCMLCVKDCPANALELVTIDKVNKRFVMIYHGDACTYCGQCLESCRFSCFNMTGEQWELASLQKQPFEVHYGKDEDVQFLLDQAAQPDAKGACGDEAKS